VSHTLWRRAVVFGCVFALILAFAGMTGCAKKAEVAEPAESAQPAEETPATSQPAEDATQDATEPTDATATDPGQTEEVTKLKIEDTKKGKGTAVKSGDNVTVDYTGWLTDGTKFDSSLDAGQPFQFTVGGGQVIKGWDEGLVGMKVGGTRKLTIPSDMGYGAQGAGGGLIPPNATLVFEIKLISID